MDILTICILLLIIFLIVSNKTDTNRKLSDIDNKLAELKRLTEEIKLYKSFEEPGKKAEETKPSITETPPVVKVDKPVNIPQPEAIVQPKPEFIKPDHVERQPEVISDSL